IMQERESISVNNQGTTINQSHHLDLAIPSSTIASLSSGEYVGLVAVDPARPIALKNFHAQLINNHKELKKEEKNYEETPIIQSLKEGQIQANFITIKEQIIDMTSQERRRIEHDPGLKDLLIKKNKS